MSDWNPALCSHFQDGRMHLARELPAPGPAVTVRRAACDDLLLPAAAHIDVRRAACWHRLASATDIVEWPRSTGLRPFIDALPRRSGPPSSPLARRASTRPAPARADGQRLLAFAHLFIVAGRQA